jgi:hypothetical protein
VKKEFLNRTGQNTINREFTYNYARYSLKAINDHHGNIESIFLTNEHATEAMKWTLAIESGFITKQIKRGISLQSLHECYCDENLSPINVWGEAFNILGAIYRSNAEPRPVKGAPHLRVYNGGMA